MKHEKLNEVFYTRFENSVNIATRQAQPSQRDMRTARSADDDTRVRASSSQQIRQKSGRQDKPATEKTRKARTKSALRCYECEGIGHFASQCPTRLNRLRASKRSPGRRKQIKRSGRPHFPPENVPNRQKQAGGGSNSSRLSAHVRAARNPVVPIFWEQHTPTVVVEIEGMSRRLILDTGSSVSILQPGISRREVQTSTARPSGATGGVLHIRGQQTVSFRLGKGSFERTFLVCSLPTKAAGLVGVDFMSDIRAVLDFEGDTMTWSREQPKPRRGKVLTTTQRALTIFSKGQDRRSPKLETSRDRQTDKQLPSNPDEEAEGDGTRLWLVSATRNFTIEPRCRQIIDGRVDVGNLQDPPALVCIEPACIPVEGILATRGLTRVQLKTPDLCRETSLASRSADALRSRCADVMVANFSEEALTISQATVFDLHTVHETLHKLQGNQENISHAVAQQLTYVKQLYEINGFHAEAIANLSGIIK